MIDLQDYIRLHENSYHNFYVQHVLSKEFFIRINSIMDSSYKYIKYKTSSYSLNGGYKKNFYFIHGTKNIMTLLSILKDGDIKLGKDVPKQYRKLSGDQPLEYIYNHIYFEDLKNLTHLQDYSLIISPDIIKDYGICFNKGWQVGPTKDSIIIEKDNDNKTIATKLKEIRKFIKNPTLPQKIIEFSPFLHHEVLFDKPIQLDKYLLGIMCLKCDNDPKFNHIEKIIKEKYPNVKILTENYPFLHFEV